MAGQIGHSVDELFAASLPAGRFVLKANLGSHMSLVLNLPDDLVSRRSEIEKLVPQWLGSRYGYAWGEWQYSTFEPKIFVEEFIDFQGKELPDDFKFFCFNGKTRLIQVLTGRNAIQRCGQYDSAWNHIPVPFKDFAIAQFERPANLDCMIHAAEAISAGLEFARVDLYSNCKNTIKFGEVTLTPGNAHDWWDFGFDRWLGSWFAKAHTPPDDLL